MEGLLYGLRNEVGINKPIGWRMMGQTIETFNVFCKDMPYEYDSKVTILLSIVYLMTGYPACKKEWRWGFQMSLQLSCIRIV